MEEPQAPSSASAAGDAPRSSLSSAAAPTHIAPRSDGLNAISLAACRARLGARCARSARRCCAGGGSRTALHWAVASRDTCAVNTCLAVRHGRPRHGAVSDTPLHLFDGPPEIMLLLLYDDDVLPRRHGRSPRAASRAIAGRGRRQETRRWRRRRRGSQPAGDARRGGRVLRPPPLRFTGVAAAAKALSPALRRRGASCGRARAALGRRHAHDPLHRVAPTTTVRVSTAAYMAAASSSPPSATRAATLARRDALGPPFPALFVLVALALLALYALRAAAARIVSPLAALLWAALAAATLYAALLRLDPGNLVFTAAERAAAADGCLGGGRGARGGATPPARLLPPHRGPRPPRSSSAARRRARRVPRPRLRGSTARSAPATTAPLSPSSRRRRGDRPSLARRPRPRRRRLGEFIPEAAACSSSASLSGRRPLLPPLPRLPPPLPGPLHSRNSTVVEMMRGFKGSYDRGSIVANWAAARADRAARPRQRRTGT